MLRIHFPHHRLLPSICVGLPAPPRPLAAAAPKALMRLRLVIDLQSLVSYVAHPHHL
jgi:hypothetical protein